MKQDWEQVIWTVIVTLIISMAVFIFMDVVLSFMGQIEGLNGKIKVLELENKYLNEKIELKGEVK